MEEYDHLLNTLIQVDIGQCVCSWTNGAECATLTVRVRFLLG